MRKILLVMVFMALSISAFARIDVGVFGGIGATSSIGSTTVNFNLLLDGIPEMKNKESVNFDVGVYAEPYIFRFLSVYTGIHYFNANPKISIKARTREETTTFKNSMVAIPLTVRAHVNLFKVNWLLGFGYDFLLSQSNSIKREGYGATPFNEFNEKQDKLSTASFVVEFGAKFNTGRIHYGALAKIKYWDIYDEGTFSTLWTSIQIFAGYSF